MLFEFNQDLYIQQIGVAMAVAMGKHSAPSYANIYIARRLKDKKGS